MGVVGGAGDALRTMRLLWEGSAGKTSRGPKASLTVDEIVSTAIAIADENGNVEVSLRAVGQRLGRTPMALYTYVGGRSELLDVMYDRVHAEFPPAEPGDDWRRDVTLWSDELLKLYIKHPWVNQVSYARPVLGPHEQQVLEWLLGVLPAGLGREDATAIISSLFALARSTARGIAEARAVAAHDAVWWQQRTAALRTVVPDFAGRFPLFTAFSRGEYAEHQEFSMDDAARAAYSGAVRLLLNGVEEL